MEKKQPLRKQTVLDELRAFTRTRATDRARVDRHAACLLAKELVAAKAQNSELRRELANSSHAVAELLQELESAETVGEYLRVQLVRVEQLLQQEAA